MATNPIPFDDVQRAVDAYQYAIEQGAHPAYTPGKVGQKSALGVAAEAIGWAATKMRRVLERAVELGLQVQGFDPAPEDAARRARHDYRRDPAYVAFVGGADGELPSDIAEERRRALRGAVGGPPIPDIAVPPEGFIVNRNSGSYDADGNLLRQWVGTRRDAGDEFTVPLGHVIKGESALVDPDGRVLVKWIKTKEGAGEGLVEGLKRAFAEYDGAAPAVPEPIGSDDDLLTVYPMPDLHLGMYAWGQETGADYDVAIAEAITRSGIEDLVSRAMPSRRAVILGLGDYFHANDQKNVTPGSGHKLDVDTRWPQVFAAGAKLATHMVDLVSRKHPEVEVVFLPGNHDPDAAICLTVALSLFYANRRGVTVYDKPGIAWYRRFGSVLLGATHGHTMKPDRMFVMMASDCAADWGMTVHRSMFFGHIHTETVKEIGGVRIESFQSPAARDSWNAGMGFRSGRSLTAITFHRDDGEIGRHRSNIKNGPVAPPAANTTDPVRGAA